jgi:hypothetical protein
MVRFRIDQKPRKPYAHRETIDRLNCLLNQANLSQFASSRPWGSGGAFAATGKAYDWLLNFEAVRSWIDNYSAAMTGRN